MSFAYNFRCNYAWDFHPDVGLVTAGGYCGGKCSSESDDYFTKEVEISVDFGVTWSNLPDMPDSVTWPCLTIVDEKTMVVTRKNLTWIFEFETMSPPHGSWRSGPDMPNHRGNHGCHTITDGQGKKKIVVMGGNHDGQRDTVDIYDVAAEVWTSGMGKS